MPLYIYGGLTTIKPAWAGGGGGGTGITSYTYTNNGYITNTGGYTVISYIDPTNNGTFNVTGITGTATVYYLAVGGGGSGGTNFGGGGGGGAVTYGSFSLSTSNNITIQVGKKGLTPAFTGLGTLGTNGGISQISGTGITIQAGGGYAGAYYGNSTAISTPSAIAYGGSGGGGGANGGSPAGSYPAVNKNTRTYFNQCGSSSGYATSGGGGGGGAGTAGVNATPGSGGGGGAGILYSSFSTDTTNYTSSINSVLALLPGTGGNSGTPGSNLFLGAGGGGSGCDNSPTIISIGPGGSSNAGGSGGYIHGVLDASSNSTVYGGGGGGGAGNNGIGGDGYHGIVMLAFSSSSIINPDTPIIFTPQSIPGLRLWLDPTDSSTITIASGNSVSQWNDKSGNGYNFTSTSGKYPSTGMKQINSKNIMDFTSTANYMVSTTLPFGPTYSIFIVAYTNSNISDNVLIRGYQNAVVDMRTTLYNSNYYYNTFVGDNSNWISVYSTPNTPNISIYSTTTPFILELTNSTTVITPYVNGTAQSTKTAGTFSATGLFLGALDANGITASQSWKGYIGDVIIYNSVLSTLNRQKVEGYLAWKWNLTSSLPTDHPYKTVQP